MTESLALLYAAINRGKPAGILSSICNDSPCMPVVYAHATHSVRTVIVTGCIPELSRMPNLIEVRFGYNALTGPLVHVPSGSSAVDLCTIATVVFERGVIR